MNVLKRMNLAYAEQLVNQLTLYLRQRKYELLLLSFMLLIFGDTFSHRFIVIISDILQNMVIGVFIFYNRKTVRNITLVLVLASVILSLFGGQFRFYIDVKSWQGVIYLIYFFMVSKEVYQEVLYAKTVTKELLAAALCGFVLLCLIATFLFYQVDIRLPGSFSNIGSERDTLKNLNYFSFTTLLTIGFGDIAPLTLVAKRAVMLMGLASHFYTVFVTSIIIGKYLSAKRN